MKVITKTFPRENIYPIERLTGENSPVLFDIETTGLKAETSYLYLIGALFTDSETLSFIQWFAEKPSEEIEVLQGFLNSLPENPCLIHFNGRGFDVPYLEKKCKQAGIPATLSQITNIDLYRSLSPLKNYFNMTSRRLVAYEKLIGLEREDIYNGGELINVYKEYVGKAKFNKDDSEELLKLLLLHNEEDIRDMVPVLSLFTYLDLFSGDYLGCYPITDCAEPPTALTLSLQFSHNFPIKSEKTLATLPGFENITVSTEGNVAVIHVPIYSGNLKHFYDDYRNYCYLPAEDTAIHKSLAASVDPDHRIAATKETAYSYASGYFIPYCGQQIKPVFKHEYNDCIAFIPLTALADDDSIRQYIKSLFK